MQLIWCPVCCSTPGPEADSADRSPFLPGVEAARAAAPLPFFSREELREMELDREAAMDAFSAPRLPGEFI